MAARTPNLRAAGGGADEDDDGDEDCDGDNCDNDDANYSDKSTTFIISSAKHAVATNSKWFTCECASHCNTSARGCPQRAHQPAAAGP
jgi:hypothetical protein